MLAGIGVEQLRRGEKPRGSLIASSFAFVMGFSVVFVAFGASASAVGQFLLQNKNSSSSFRWRHYRSVRPSFNRPARTYSGPRGSDHRRAACIGRSGGLDANG